MQIEEQNTAKETEEMEEERRRWTERKCQKDWKEAWAKRKSLDARPESRHWIDGEAYTARQSSAYHKRSSSMCHSCAECPEDRESEQTWQSAPDYFESQTHRAIWICCLWTHEYGTKLRQEKRKWKEKQQRKSTQFKFNDMSSGTWGNRNHGNSERKAGDTKK